MEKMIIGLISSVLGGLGFVYSLGGIADIIGTIPGMPGFETVINPGIFPKVIIFIISLVIFGIGVMLIQADREVGI